MSIYKNSKRPFDANRFKMLPQINSCICGRNKLHRVHNNGLIKVVCDCGREGEWGKTEREARESWNRLNGN